MCRIIIFLTLAVHFCACQSYHILQKPITFNETRRLLTLQYLQENYHISRQDYPLIEPTMIVIHWTTLGDLESAFKVFQDPVRPRFRNDDPFLPPQLNFSAHYLVDRDGAIYQLLPDSIMALHVAGLNYCALGIKNVGNDLSEPLTEDQLNANIFLVKMLAKKYPVKFLIGNFEVPLFREHEAWKNFGDEPLEDKTDPGTVFMHKLREEVKKLGLSGPPTN